MEPVSKETDANFHMTGEMQRAMFAPIIKVGIAPMEVTVAMSM